MKTIKKEKNDLVEKLTFIRRQIKELKKLENRDHCPCCKQKISRESIDKELKQRIKEKQEIDERLDLILPIFLAEQRKQAIKQERIEHAFKIKYSDFYKKNKKLFSSITRAYNKGLDISLPQLSETERKYWNKAMEYIHLNRPKFEELEFEEELFF